MSYLKVAGINHPSATTGGLAISSGGIVTGGGLDYITSSTFSAASTVSVDGCFTSQYDNYKIIIECPTSGAVEVRMRLRSAGADDSTSAYFFAGTRTTTAASVSGLGGATATYFQVSSATGSSPISCYSEFTLNNPAKVSRTMYSGSGAGYAGGASTYTAETTGGQFTSTTSFDGFTVYPSSGTITGTLTVYGYRKA